MDSPKTTEKPLPAESERARLLLDLGVAACAQGNFIRAENLFTDVKNTAAADDAAFARLCLVALYVTQYVPGCSDTENLKWLQRAECECFAVLDQFPFASSDRIQQAISGLGSIAVFRRPPK